jgi:hypothetical protein
MPGAHHCGRQLRRIDENNNPVLNPANIDRGANHLAEGQTVESLAARKKFDYQSMSER